LHSKKHLQKNYKYLIGTFEKYNIGTDPKLNFDYDSASDNSLKQLIPRK